MSHSFRFVYVSFAAAVAFTLSLWFGVLHDHHAIAADDHAKLEPIDPSMHEFMEHVFEGPYKRMKVGLAGEAANVNWRAIKDDALTLAEVTNLLLTRLPDEDADSWKRHALDTRKSGAELYGAVKKRDLAAVKDRFAAMLKTCNACHNTFAGGEHQLSP